MSVELGGRQIRLCDCFAIRDDSVLTLHPDTGQIESISLAPATQPERAAIQAATAAAMKKKKRRSGGAAVDAQPADRPTVVEGAADAPELQEAHSRHLRKPLI